MLSGQLVKNLSKFTQLEISKLFASTKRCLRSKSLDILLGKRDQLKMDGRILVITPRKIGNAPQRNKVRRRLKALYYELELFKKGYDCVIVVKKEGIEEPFENLKSYLLQAYASPYISEQKHDQ